MSEVEERANQEVIGLKKLIFPDQMAITPESQPSNIVKLGGLNEYETESAKCDCCGLTEERTKAYIERVRERYSGTWMCGLCSEATKDEIVRSERLVSTEEAMKMHMSFCGSFKAAGPPANPAAHLIAAMRQFLCRSLESPRATRSLPSSPMRGQVPLKSLMLSESCFLPIVDGQDGECKLGY